jgi:hypothetical protein
MLVKAKWNVKDEAGWHSTGDVFMTDADLGDAVEVLDAPKKAPEATKVPDAPKAPEAPAEDEKPKTSRRKASK